MNNSILSKIFLTLIVIILFFVVSSLIGRNNSINDNTLRLIKLANSYKEAGQYNKAIETANNALSKISNRNDYWEAACCEVLALTYKELYFDEMITEDHVNSKSINLNLQKSNEYLEKAIQKYSKALKSKNGSNDAIQSIKIKLKNLNDLKLKFLNQSNVLNLDNSKLKEIPSIIDAKCNNISAENNKIVIFPNYINNLQNIQYLNLSNNKIAKLDIQANKLQNLIFLNLANNKISSISGELNMLSSLRLLDLSNNKLKNLPQGLSELKKLKVLNLKGNKIPFSYIKTLIQNLPNTNILHDEYILKEKKIEEEENTAIEGF